MKLVRIFFRNSTPEVFLGKSVLKICSRFIGEYHCSGVSNVDFEHIDAGSALPVFITLKKMSTANVFNMKRKDNTTKAVNLDQIFFLVIMNILSCSLWLV